MRRRRFHLVLLVVFLTALPAAAYPQMPPINPAKLRGLDLAGAVRLIDAPAAGVLPPPRVGPAPARKLILRPGKRSASR